MTRNEARTILMQILFEMDAGKSMNPETACKLAEERLTGNHKQRGTDLLTEILTHMEEIDASINANSPSWKTGRMPKVDLAIMRLALGEIRYSDDIPEAVAINEAINLAKEYSTDRSAKFVHGVLGAVLNTSDES